MKSYKVIQGGGLWGVADGDTIEIDIDAQLETEYVGRGLLEILPRTYAVIGPLEVHGAKPDETFTEPLSLAQEDALVKGGHIVLAGDPKKGVVKRARPQAVRRTYKVIGDHEVHGATKDETFTAALPPEQEDALIKGKHIKLVEDEPKAKKGGNKRG